MKYLQYSTRRAWQRVAAGLLLGFLGMAVTPLAAFAEDTPDQLVRSVADDVLKLAKQDRERGAAQSKLVALVEQRLLPYFDFDRMTKLALGKNWRQASAEQRQALVHSFRELLLTSYTAAYSTYKDVSVEVKPLKMKPGEDDVLVRTLIRLPGSSEPIAVDYSMYQATPSWKVYDVVVNGVSLVTTYRSSFNDEIGRGGIDGLVHSLSAKSGASSPAKAN